MSPILRCPKGVVLEGFIDGKITIANPTTIKLTVVHNNGDRYELEPGDIRRIPTWDYDPKNGPWYTCPESWRVENVNIWVDDDRPPETDVSGMESINHSIYDPSPAFAELIERNKKRERDAAFLKEFPMANMFAGDAGSAGEAGQAGSADGRWSWPDNIKPGSPPDDWKALQIAALNSGEIDALNGGNRPSTRPCAHEARVFIETREDGSHWLRFCFRGNGSPPPDRFFANAVTLRPGPKLTNSRPGCNRLWGSDT